MQFQLHGLTFSWRRKSMQVKNLMFGKKITSQSFHRNQARYQSHKIHSYHNVEDNSSKVGPKKVSINKALSNAEKVVGVPISYLNLQALVSDELKAVAINLRKLVKSNHPIVKTAREVLFETNHLNTQARGVVVLLTAKIISETGDTLKKADSNDAYEKQRVLAKLTELLHVAFLIHRGLLDLQKISKSHPDLELGNKMAVLCGDFLLANATVKLSELQNSKVLGLMANSIRDLSRGFFLVPESRDLFYSKCVDKFPCNIKQWQHQTALTHGSLLSNACRAATELCHKSSKYGDDCAEFGRHLMLAQQAHSDINNVRRENLENNNITQFLSMLNSLPSAIAAELNGGRNWMCKFVHKNRDGQTFSVMKAELLSAITSCPSTLRLADEICQVHLDATLNALYRLPDNEARKTLETLVLSFVS